MPAKSQEDTRTVLEGRQKIERSDAASRTRRDAVLDRQHERWFVVRVNELRRDDADDAAVPVLTSDDQDVLSADGRIALDDPLGVRENRRLLFLAKGVLFG